MNVLVLCDRYPFPLYNGQNLRIFHYVRSLRGRHRFDLMCYGEATPSPELQEIFYDIAAYPPPRRGRQSLWGRLRTALVAREMLPPNPPFREALQQRLRDGRYDVLWMSGWDTAGNIPQPSPIPFLADIVDDGVLEYWRELWSRCGLWRRLRMAKRVWQSVLMERHYFSKADSCLVVSERDAQVFRRVCPQTPVTVINNGVDTEAFQPQGLPEEPATLVLEGSMEFPPNVDAAVYLVQEILPLVHRKLPKARVVLVGRDPAPEIRALAGPQVEITGFVDDVRPYLDRATIFVCPMRKGAGIKNKILQAWAMAKPIVATPTAVGGLTAVDNENILIREGNKELAGAIVALLRDESTRKRLGAAGRRLVLARYTWAAKAAELEALLMDIGSTQEVRRATA